MDRIEEGYIVKLKSGGPNMTVEYTRTDYSTKFRKTCFCIWFDDENKVKGEYFPSSCLKIIN